MDNLFRQDKISVNIDVMERANPIFNTAKSTLYLLGESGDRDAKLLASELGLSFDSTQNANTTRQRPTQTSQQCSCLRHDTGL